MSTSFSYGCLYAVRREVQGTGLTWTTIWEESNPGDPMSLGLMLAMIFIDGCIYALIGYLVTRYTNSGKKERISSAETFVVNMFHSILDLYVGEHISDLSSPQRFHNRKLL